MDGRDGNSSHRAIPTDWDFLYHERYVPPFPEEEEYAPPSDSDDDDMSDVIDEEAEAQKSEEDRERAAEEREEKWMRKKAKRDSARKALDKLNLVRSYANWHLRREERK
jgi:hypothetical protein